MASSAVVDSLRWRSGIPAEHIKATVSNGWVTLEGDVNFHFQKQEADEPSVLSLAYSA